MARLTKREKWFSDVATCDPVRQSTCNQMHDRAQHAPHEGYNPVHMAKGQLRSNREKKKPKQPAKPVAPVNPFNRQLPKKAG